LLRKAAGGKIVKGKAGEFGAFPTWRLLIMKKIIPIVCMSILAVVTAKAQDPVKVDPGHFKVILDNKQVRVMDVRTKPGEKLPMHSHPNHVIYYLAGGTTKFTLADGKTDTVTSKAGQVIWHNAETHTVENVGKTETHGLDIELKK
jgi:quercetin dioxygenase-like cupin family protein